MKSAWVERDAKDGGRSLRQGRRCRRPGAARLYHPPARPRPDAGAARRRQHFGEDADRRPARRGDRRALRQGLGLGHGQHRAGRHAGRAARRAAQAAQRATAVPDDEMVRVQRASLIDPMAPNPSVETLLHAFVPHKFVDHTHATAVLGLIDQPDGRARARRSLRQAPGLRAATSCPASGSRRNPPRCSTPIRRSRA